MKHGFMSHNEGQIYYEATGSGEPVVFVHGFTLDHSMWQPQVDHFGSDYNVVTYDARGFGQSSLPDAPYSHADDLNALLEHQSIEQAHIVGLSLGGRIATNFALTYPERVRSLTLMAAALDGYRNEVDWNVHAQDEGLEQARENWLQHELFDYTQHSPDVVKALRKIVENYSGWHWLHEDPHSPANTHARDRLHEITQPALVVIGESDLQYFQNISDVLASGIPGAQKARIPEAGHMVNMEAPDQVNRLLGNFLMKIP